MRGELLLDTGALASLLDRSQTHHLKCRRAFADWTGPVVSTEAVLTEATHLLAGAQGGRAGCVRVHDGSHGLFSLPSQRAEALSHCAERLSTSVRSPTMKLGAQERRMLESVTRGEWRSVAGGKRERARSLGMPRPRSTTTGG